MMISSIKRLFVFTFIAMTSVILLYSCITKKVAGRIQGVEVSNKSSILPPDYHRIYHFDSLVMYVLHYMHDSVYSTISEDSITKEFIKTSRLISKTWRDRYFVFHLDSMYGYSYSAFEPRNNNVRMRVDSMVNFIAGSNRFDSTTRGPDSVIYNPGKTELREVFVWPKTGEFPPGSLTLYYSSKLNHLKPSLNPVLDSVKKMKFYKSELKYEAFTDSSGQAWKEAFNITEMKELKTFERDTIEGMFKRYRREVQKIN